MDRDYGTLIDVPSYNETEYGVTENGTGYQVDVYADRVHFRARNYITHTWMPQYDIILSAPSLPAVTSEGESLTNTGYTEDSWSRFTEALTAAQSLMDTNNESMRLEVLEASINLDAAIDGLQTTNVDKSSLEALYNQYKDLDKTGYTAETWETFTEALKAAETVLADTEAAQEQVDAAADALQTAVDGLRVSKTMLEYFLNQAKLHVENGDTADVVGSIKQLFDEAIAEGEAVMAKENATKEEVTNATTKLMLAIQALDMKAGDKTDLEMALELAEMIDLDKYAEAGQDVFLAAKEAAETVLADSDAMQGDIDDAWTALTEAMSVLRLKADKAALEDLLNSIENLDLSQYTEESVQAFNTALSAAKAVMADKTLTDEDQKTVDEAVQNLAEARDALTLKDNTSGENGENSQNPGSGDTGSDDNNTGEGGVSSGTGNGSTDAGNKDNNNNTGNDAPKTGDQTNALLWAVVMMLAGGLGIAAWRRKARQ